jgi:hypothetical protein
MGGFSENTFKASGIEYPNKGFVYWGSWKPGLCEAGTGRQHSYWAVKIS